MPVGAVAMSIGAVMGPVAHSNSSIPGTAAWAVAISPFADGFCGFGQLDGIRRTVLRVLGKHGHQQGADGQGQLSGSGGGASLTWASAMAIWDSPENGRCPVRHS